MRKSFVVKSIICFLFFPHFVFADLSVSPMLVSLNAKRRMAAVKVRNTDEEEITLQVRVMARKQNDLGKSEFEKTKNISFFPKMLRIRKGEKRIIRIGYRAKPPVSREAAYTLFIKKIPKTIKGKKKIVRVALTMGVAIYVSPLKGIVRERAIEEIEFSEGKFQLQVKNKGNVHVVIGTTRLRGLDSAGTEVFSKETNDIRGHLLAGKSKTLLSDIPTENCMKMKTLEIEVEDITGGEKTLMKSQLDVDKDKCK